MSSSSDVRARRPRVVRPDVAIGPAALPELTSVVLHVDDRPVDERYEQGWVDGHTAALATAVATATADARAAEARAQQLAGSLADAATGLQARCRIELDGYARELAEAALTLAEAIVGRALAGEAPAVAAVARALALVPSGDPAVVRLHPDDVAVVGEVVRPDVRVVADAAVRPGGCVVESGASTVDGGLEAALDRARAALLDEGHEPW